MMNFFNVRIWLLTSSFSLGLLFNGLMHQDANSPAEQESRVTAGSNMQTVISNASSISNADWKNRLTPEQFQVLRKHGTERAFSGMYWNTKESGNYRCAACNQLLFDSATKFDSGTGGPVFGSQLTQRM